MRFFVNELNKIEAVKVVLLLLTLIGLVWYTFETHLLRIATQRGVFGYLSLAEREDFHTVYLHQDGNDTLFYFRVFFKNSGATPIQKLCFSDVYFQFLRDDKKEKIDINEGLLKDSFLGPSQEITGTFRFKINNINPQDLIPILKKDTSIIRIKASFETFNKEELFFEIKLGFPEVIPPEKEELGIWPIRIFDSRIIGL